MKKFFLSALILLFCCRLSAQNENAEIRKTVDDLFLSMQTGDSALLKSCFHEDATLKSVYEGSESVTQVMNESVNNFAIAVGSPHKEKYNEKIHDVEIKIDGPLAVVWAPYEFYLDDKLSHRGVNVFEMVYYSGKWLILSITDTRRK